MKPCLISALVTVVLATSCKDERVTPLKSELTDLRQDVSELKSDMESQVTPLKMRMDKAEQHDKDVDASVADLSKTITDLQASLTTLKKATETPGNASMAKAVDSAILLSTMANEGVRRKACEILGFLGGKTATVRLVAVAENETTTSVKLAALTSLSKMQHPGYAKLLMTNITTGSDSSFQRSVCSLLERGATQDMAEPLLKRAYQTQLSTDYSDRYLRSSIYKILSKIVDKKNLPMIQKLTAREKELQGEAFGLLARVSEDPIGLIAEKLATVNIAKMRNSTSGLFELIKGADDMRLTAPLIRILQKSGKSYSRATREAIRILDNIQDPVAAETLVAFHGKSSRSYTSELEQLFSNGHPGISYDEKTKKASLVPKDQLDKLIAKRNEAFKKEEAERSPKTP